MHVLCVLKVLYKQCVCACAYMCVYERVYVCFMRVCVCVTVKDIVHAAWVGRSNT